jgi:uncharacterized membrane protein YhfC
VVAPAILAGLAVSALLALAWPALVFVICRRRMTLAARNILVGAGVFFAFSQVLEKAMHAYLLRANPVTAAWFQAPGIAFAVYGSLAAGLFEEVGRYVGMRLMVKPTRSPGPAVAYGIGHGGIESVLLGGLAMVQAFAFAILLNSGKFDATFGPALPPDALNQIRASIENLTLAGLALATIERLVALLTQIGLSLVVWRAVEGKRLSLLAIAVLLHAVVDFPAGLFQAGEIPTIAAEAPIFAVGIGLAALFVYKLPRHFE